MRAYQRAVKEGLAAAKILEKYEGYQLTVKTDYNGIGKIQYIAGQMGVLTVDTDYGEAVAVRLMVHADELEAFVKKITEATNGQADIRKSEELFFGVLEGKVIL